MTPNHGDEIERREASKRRAERYGAMANEPRLLCHRTIEQDFFDRDGSDTSASPCGTMANEPGLFYQRTMG